MKHSREITAISLPAIISNLTTPVLGLVDVAISGHIGDALYIAAIAVGGTLFNTLYWLFGFLRMGSSGLTAQAYGAGDSKRSTLVIYRGLLIGLVMGVLLVALSGVLAPVLIGMMDVDKPTGDLVASYFGICIWGAPAVLMSYALAGWFIGMQDSRSAMWMAITTNVVNIAVSLSLVFGLDWKIKGVATGTMTAQWVGALLGLGIVFIKYRPARQPFSTVLNLRDLLGFFRVNTDIFLRTCCLVGITLWFTHAGVEQGTLILAANALLLQLFMLFSYFMDGFAYAAEALVGKYAGRSDGERLGSVITALIKVGLWCAVVFSALYLVAGEWFVGVLAESRKVVSVAIEYLPWAIALPLCGFLAFVWDGVYIGLVATRSMLLTMALAVVVFFVVYMPLHHQFGNHALWLSFDLYLLSRGVFQWLLWRLKKHSMLCG